MTNLSRLPQRRALRLQGYDYSQAGAYFVTICVQGREGVLGSIRDEIYTPSVYGQIAMAVWDELPTHFPLVELDYLVVMPNHMHRIIVLTDSVGAGFPRPMARHRSAEVAGEETSPLQRPALRQNPSNADGEPPPLRRLLLGQVVAYYKYQTTKQVNLLRGTAGAKLWQRSYYDHIIRHDADLERIRQYILTNPQRWDQDQLHPNNPSRW